MNLGPPALYMIFLRVYDGACTLLDKLLSSLVVDEIEA